MTDPVVIRASSLPPGLFRDIPASSYHADPCERPSLSASIAKKIVNGAPVHGWFAHPRLNPYYDPAQDEEIKRKTAFGSAAHELMLEKGGGIHVMKSLDKDGNPVDAYRTKEAKAERDGAMEDGLVVVKQAEFDLAAAVVEEAKRQIGWFPFSGESEIVAIAELEGVLCRVMIDRLLEGGIAMVDLKFTQVSASPRDWTLQAYRMGYHIQAALYRRVLAEVQGVDPHVTRFMFMVVEIGPPVCVIVHELPGDLMEVGEHELTKALTLFRGCLAKGTERRFWPGYDQGVHVSEAPGFVISRYESEKQLGELTVLRAIEGFAPHA